MNENNSSIKDPYGHLRNREGRSPISNFIEKLLWASSANEPSSQPKDNSALYTFTPPKPRQNPSVVNTQPQKPISNETPSFDPKSTNRAHLYMEEDRRKKTSSLNSLIAGADAKRSSQQQQHQPRIFEPDKNQGWEK